VFDEYRHETVKRLQFPSKVLVPTRPKTSRYMVRGCWKNNALYWIAFSSQNRLGPILTPTSHSQTSWWARCD
jgi:hypothetical protein